MQFFWGRRDNSDTITIEGEESRHLIKSLRKKVGDIVQVIDGSGSIYIGQIETIKRVQVVLHFLEATTTEKHWPGNVHVAIALTKRTDRIEWFIEKSVESGIDEISFIETQYAERTRIREERIDNIIRSAMKQSGNIFSPKVNYNVPLLDLIKPSKDHTILFTCQEGNQIHFREFLTTAADYTFLIGPEGDFSPSEIELAKQNGVNIATMGISRLRTETAGLIALAGFHFRFNPAG